MSTEKSNGKTQAQNPVESSDLLAAYFISAPLNQNNGIPATTVATSKTRIGITIRQIDVLLVTTTRANIMNVGILLAVTAIPKLDSSCNRRHILLNDVERTGRRELSIVNRIER